ncbi:unnamed protein product [Prunus brigantina]
MEPSTRCLFEAIECFVELANIRRTSEINETRGLSHVDIFLKKPMEKGIFDIKLTKGPTMRNCKTKNSANGGSLTTRLKCRRYEAWAFECHPEGECTCEEQGQEIAKLFYWNRGGPKLLEPGGSELLELEGSELLEHGHA